LSKILFELLLIFQTHTRACIYRYHNFFHNKKTKPNNISSEFTSFNLRNICSNAFYLNFFITMKT